MIDAELISELRRSFAAALDHDDAVKARIKLIEAGWLDALAHDESVAVAVAFRLQGSSCCDVAALDDVMTRHLRRKWPELEGDVAIAHPVARSSAVRPVVTHVVLPGHQEPRWLVWASDLGGEALQLVELDDSLRAETVDGIDEDFGLVGLSDVPAGRLIRLEGAGGAETWTGALAAGRVAVAHQMIAGAHTVLELATAYAGARRQFGQPIAGFQAVKHRLAEVLVAIASADAAAVAAASAQEPVAAAVAKALAGRAAAVSAKHCLQVLGGIGFTSEHEFHRYFRRNLALDRLLGDHRSIERQLGEQLRTGLLAGHRVIDLHHEPLVDLLGASPSVARI